jgi:hypothetical protein
MITHKKKKPCQHQTRKNPQDKETKEKAGPKTQRAVESPGGFRFGRSRNKIWTIFHILNVPGASRQGKLDSSLGLASTSN